MNAADYLLQKSPKLDKDFIVGTKENLSYKDLYEKVNALSAYLCEKIGTGKEIMLLSENNVFFIISYLSIIKSGNTVILLEAKISEGDLEYIFKKCSINAVFVQDKFAFKVTKFSGKLNKKIFTESILKGPSTDSRKTINIKNRKDDIALVIFTSGSTGKKKGVILTHANIKANTESIIEYLGLKNKDRIEVVLPFFYSYGLSLLNTHLRVGGSMVINHSIFLGSAMGEIKKYKCTGFAGVPSTFQILINKTDFLKQKFSSIRYFTQAGGKLSNKFIKNIVKAFHQKLFFVMYGATEATARLSFLPPNLVTKKLGSIGKGIPNVKLKVVDAKGNPVKVGEIGEISAEGRNIMKGYYKDPEATKKSIKNGKLYTGDLAIVDEEGFIYIVGRAKNMIKSAGHKVFPAEIEETINYVRDVSDCAAFGRPDEILGEAIIVAVSTKKPSEKLKKEILSYCARTAPSYKVPKDIVFFDEFPLNASKKINRLKIKEALKIK